MDFNQFNAMISGVAPDDSTGGRHPVGYFDGIVDDVKLKTSQKGARFWSIQLKTDKGFTWVNIFDITPETLHKMATDPSIKEKVLKGVARYKKYYIDLGILTVQEAIALDWNGVTSNLGLLKGRRCGVTVKVDAERPGETMTFLNAPTVSEAPYQRFPSASPNPYPNQLNQSQSQPYQQVVPNYTQPYQPSFAGQQQPPPFAPTQQVNLDSVPF